MGQQQLLDEVGYDIGSRESEQDQVKGLSMTPLTPAAFVRPTGGGKASPAMRRASAQRWYWLARCWLIGGLLLCGYLFVRAMPGSPFRSPAPRLANPSVARAALPQRRGVATSQRPGSPGVQFRSRRFDEALVGQYLLGQAPEVAHPGKSLPSDRTTIALQQSTPRVSGLVQLKEDLALGAEASATRPAVLLFEVKDGTITKVVSESGEALSPGYQKLVGSQYVVGSVDATDVTEELWREAELVVTKADGSQARLWVLRPLWWYREQEAGVGRLLKIELPEIGIAGTARVRRIGPATIEREGQTGRFLIISKIEHNGAEVWDLFFDGGTEPMGVTANHPLYSAERQAWIEAGRLRIGESVCTVSGEVRLLGKLLRAGRHTVYNLEVHRSHTYYVSPQGVLAHNTCPNAPRIHLNGNTAVSNYGLYEIEVNGALYKIGKADLNRVTQSSGLPTRLHQQVRKLREQYGDFNVSGQVVELLGNVSTQEAKLAESARIQRYFDQTRTVPVGNVKSFVPQQP